MFFLVLVVVPWLRSGQRQNAGAFLQETGTRFRSVGWVCFGLVVITGTFNLWVRGVRLGDFFQESWRRSDFGKAVLFKLSVFVVVLILSGIHDFIIGPQATRVLQEDPTSTKALQLRRQASLMGRANALLALVLVACAVVLVRGC